jgi:hypothetical protein
MYGAGVSTEIYILHSRPLDPTPAHFKRVGGWPTAPSVPSVHSAVCDRVHDRLKRVGVWPMAFLSCPLLLLVHNVICVQTLQAQYQAWVRANSRDVYQSYSSTYKLPGFKKHLSEIQQGHELPWWAKHTSCLWLFGCMFCGWCYQVAFKGTGLIFEQRVHSRMLLDRTPVG